jgi:hypothetical protein
VIQSEPELEVANLKVSKLDENAAVIGRGDKARKVG